MMRFVEEYLSIRNYRSARNGGKTGLFNLVAVLARLPARMMSHVGLNETFSTTEVIESITSISAFGFLPPSAEFSIACIYWCSMFSVLGVVCCAPSFCKSGESKCFSDRRKVFL